MSSPHNTNNPGINTNVQGDPGQQHLPQQQQHPQQQANASFGDIGASLTFSGTYVNHQFGIQYANGIAQPLSNSHMQSYGSSNVNQSIPMTFGYTHQNYSVPYMQQQQQQQQQPNMINSPSLSSTSSSNVDQANSVIPPPIPKRQQFSANQYTNYQEQSISQTNLNQQQRYSVPAPLPPVNNTPSSTITGNLVYTSVTENIPISSVPNSSFNLMDSPIQANIPSTSSMSFNFQNQHPISTTSYLRYQYSAPIFNAVHQNEAILSSQPHIPHHEQIYQHPQQLQQQNRYIPNSKRSEEEEKILRIESLKNEIREKLKKKKDEFEDKSKKELNILIQQQKELFKNDFILSKLEELMKQKLKFLESEDNELKLMIDQLNQTLKIMHSQNKEIDGDCMQSIIRTSGTLEDQVIQLISQDRAIEDTIFFIGKAVERERILPSSAVKRVRALAREQFVSRAHIRKICMSLEACLERK